MAGKAPLLISAVLCQALVAGPAAAEGTVEGLRDYKYWDDGKTRGCDIYDKTGHLRARSFNRTDGTVEKIEKFDLSGNRVEEVLYDGNSKMRTGIDGWAAKRWWYDGSRLVSEMSYDEEGHPLSRRLYNEGGNLVAAQFANDANINPYEEANVRLLLLAKRRN